MRIVNDPSICQAPQYLAADLLRAEGFTEIEYVSGTDGFGAGHVAAGKADFMMDFTGLYLTRIDAGDPIVLLAGIHIGCFEVFARDDIRSMRDLKGKTVGVLAESAAEHIFLSSAMAHVGLNPRKDVHWQLVAPDKAIDLFAEGKIDAYAGFPPVPQELRRRRIGRLILNTTTDRPWSQYFCCALGSNRNFIDRNPSAAKAAMRAMLKAADICQAEPERAARYMVEHGYVDNLEVALQTMREIPYAPWRSHDPADTIRFYGLRLHEAGMIRQTPNRLAAIGTDWRFLNELRRELKG